MRYLYKRIPNRLLLYLAPQPNSWTSFILYDFWERALICDIVATRKLIRLYCTRCEFELFLASYTMPYNSGKVPSVLVKLWINHLLKDLCNPNIGSLVGFIAFLNTTIQNWQSQQRLLTMLMTMYFWSNISFKYKNYKHPNTNNIDNKTYISIVKNIRNNKGTYPIVLSILYDNF